MSATQAKIYALAQQGVPDDVLATVRALDQQIVAMEESRRVQAELAGQGARVFESTRTEAEKFARELERLNALRSGGHIDSDTYSRALKAADPAFQAFTRHQEQIAADAKRVWEQTRTPLEKYREEVNRLNNLKVAGKIDQPTYQRAVNQANPLQSEGDRVRQSVQTPDQRFNQEQARLNDLLKAGVIDATTFGKAVRQIDPAYQAARQAADKMKADGKSVYDSLLTDAQKFEREVIRLKELKIHGVIDPATFKKAVEAIDPARKALDALKAEGARVFESTRTPVEQYKSKVAELSKLLRVGALDQDTYNRAVKAIPRPNIGGREELKSYVAGLKDQITGFRRSADEAARYKLAQAGVSAESLKGVAALQKQAAALTKVKQSQEGAASRGKAFAESTMSPLSRQLRTLGDLRTAYKTGGISAGEFSRSIVLGPGVASTKALAAGITAVSVAALAAVTGLAAFTRSNLRAVDEMGDSAQRIGLNLGSYSKLQAALQYTGSETEDLDQTISKLNINLGKAASEGGPTSDALRRIGLDAVKLASSSPDEAFYKIAEGFTSITNPAERASLVMEIFGKSGNRVLNSLAAGKELRRIGDDAKRMGLTLSQVEADQAGLANDAIDRITGLFGKLAQKIAVGFAPQITALGDGFTAWATSSLDAGAMVDRVLAGASDGIKLALDTLNVFTGGWKGVSAVVSITGAGVVGALGLVAKAIEAVVNLVPGIHVAVGDTFLAISKDLAKLAGDQTQEAKQAFNSDAGDRLKAKFDATTIAARKAVGAVGGVGLELGKLDEAMTGRLGDLKADLQLKIDTHGLDEFEAKLLKLKKDGATETQVKEVQKLSDAYKALTIKSVESPFKKYKTELDALNRIKASGSINEDQFQQGKTKAQKEILGIDEKPLDRFLARFKEIIQLRDAGVITPVQFKVEVDKSKNEGLGDLGSDVEKSALQFRTDIDTLNGFLRAGVIGQEDYQRALRKSWEGALGSTADVIKTPGQRLKEGLDRLAQQAKQFGLTTEQINKAAKAIKDQALGWISDALKNPLADFKDKFAEARQFFAEQRKEQGIKPVDHVQVNKQMIELVDARRKGQIGPQEFKRERGRIQEQADPMAAFRREQAALAKQNLPPKQFRRENEELQKKFAPQIKIDAQEKRVNAKNLEEAFPGLDALKGTGDRLKEFADQLSYGVKNLGLGKDQASKLFANKREELFGVGAESKPTAALDIRSTEARSQIIAYNTGGKNNDAKDTARNTARTAEAVMEMVRLTRGREQPQVVNLSS